MMDTTYYVWKRTDGYVAATTYPPIPASEFEVLLISAEWAECKQVIIDNREGGSNG